MNRKADPSKRSRHGRTAPDQIKLSCKTDFDTWRRVGKAAEMQGKDVSEYLRGMIMEAVWQIPLDKTDYEIIENQKKNRKERGI